MLAKNHGNKIALPIVAIALAWTSLGILFSLSPALQARAEEAATAAKAPTICSNRLALPILRPQMIYDLREYCGGEIRVF